MMNDRDVVWHVPYDTRAIRATTLILGALVLIAGVASAQRAPLKIGMANGLALYLDEQKQRLAGREVKLIVEDTEAKPATALTKARALLGGPLATAEGYAVMPYIESRKINRASEIFWRSITIAPRLLDDLVRA